MEGQGKKCALVAGASGVIGRNLVLYLDKQEGWEIISLGRRRPDYKSRATHLCVDLLDYKSLAEALSSHTNITHVFFAAYLEKATQSELIGPNMLMLENVVQAVEKVAPGLQHISLAEGTKWYGCHLGPFKTPAKEDDPRHMPPNFYYNQEDYLRSRVAQGAKWSWSGVRPNPVCGFAVGNPMNLVTVIAVYASCCKELGLPLRWPGTVAAYSRLLEVVDVEVLVKMMVWAATNPKCANEAFNCSNGDVFRWENVWPDIAKAFGLQVAPPVPMTLNDMMSDKGPLWDSMVQKYDLAPTPYDKAVSWPFGDWVFSREYDWFADVSKARRFGFQEMNVDTHEMFVRMIHQLQKERVIPSFKE